MDGNPEASDDRSHQRDPARGENRPAGRPVGRKVRKVGTVGHAGISKALNSFGAGWQHVTDMKMGAPALPCAGGGVKLL
ncbi:hypothetical protein CDS [Bradyrhizobium sp.]|nr:hypothetical protein CDS [Bradyrhizobium sp.]